MVCLITYTSDIQRNKLTISPFKYQNFTSSIMVIYKMSQYLDIPKGSSIAVVFARFFGPLSVKRHWSTYS